MLSIRNVTKVFDTKERVVTAIEDATLDVRDGEFMSFVGPSGCGKTTLLKIVDGLIPASDGQILLDGQELRGISQQMAFVFQDINLLPWRSVLRNVEIGLEARGIAAEERRRQAEQALNLVDLGSLAHVQPYTLSGGMQQRVGVARALATQPKVLLMDEPFGQLDNFTRETLQIEVAKLWRKIGMTIIFVTHDVDEAIFLSDRITLFQGSPGRITEVLDVGLPHPRWEYNVHAEPRAIELREYIVQRLGVRERVAV